MIAQNSYSLDGNGMSIIFWLDRWCGLPLLIKIDISDQVNLSNSVANFLVDG